MLCNGKGWRLGKRSEEGQVCKSVTASERFPKNGGAELETLRRNRVCRASDYPQKNIGYCSNIACRIMNYSVYFTNRIILPKR